LVEWRQAASEFGAVARVVTGFRFGRSHGDLRIDSALESSLVDYPNFAFG
jgi:hypothetical protein